MPLKQCGVNCDSIRNVKTSNAVTALAALAQETRLGVFRLLVQQGASGMSAGEIAAELDVSPATLSFHLKELAHAGLVEARHVGRFIYYSADFGAMNALLAFLTEKCCGGDPLACDPRSVSTVAKRAPKKHPKRPVQTNNA